jgi:trichohyalin
LATRWRTLPLNERKKYEDLEAQDGERFDRESAEADSERLQIQEERRRALVVQEGEDGRSRGARQRIQEERDIKEAERERRRLLREAEMDQDEVAERQRIKDEKRRETEERQRRRAEEENALNKQHRKLDKEQAKKAADRLEYLFKQSNIFAKLKMGTGSMEDDKEEDEEEGKEGGGDNDNKKKKGGEDDTQRKGDRNKKKAAKEAEAQKDPKKPHHIHTKDSDVEEDLVEDEENEASQHVFLTKQPNCIKHGQLKPYQLESLNWMIHLAEKGLNGILADEVSGEAASIII